MGLFDVFDTVALIVIIASLGVGVFEASENFGELTDMLDSAVSDPVETGGGMVLFVLCLDVWTPGLPVEMLPSWLQWLEMFYPFTGGYLPHFSIWVCAGAFLFAAAITWIVLKVKDEWGFWGKGLLVAVVAFILGWYVLELIAWWCLGFGAELCGLGSENAYDIWYAAVTATQAPALQYFFLVSIVFSVGLVYRKFAGALF
ncbi:MAG: hypothetical protein NWF06_01740 [Candidatus Bathyarchaeota archaeon]|nr:hypothetical protein [Candidatus Bathyarchaeum sp.]